MFEKILIPLDGGELAEGALPYAEELAAKLGSGLELLHVRRPERQNQERMHQVYLDKVAESVRININKLQSGSQVKVTTRVEAGEPPENICELVAREKVDMIVMTAVGASGLRVGKTLGSVSDHVCRTVPIPVMLIRPVKNTPLKMNSHLFSHILIPQDGSELSKLALPVGEELASKLKSSILLFQMARLIRLYGDIPTFSTYTTAYVDYSKINEIEKQRVVEEMLDLENELKQKGLDVTSQVLSGFDAAYEINEMCNKNGIDLVVMSTHGRTGLGHWVFGNVAEKLVRQGTTPLLLVHASAR
jgi:nucleotide-binding universal stress UspA family protein